MLREMIGHKFNRKYCGFYGDISVFSFYANKHITTGEGGMLLTDNKQFYLKIEKLKNLCFGKINSIIMMTLVGTIDSQIYKLQ